MTESAKRVLWRERVLAFENSGLQRGVWCARHNFKVATLECWLKAKHPKVNSSLSVRLAVNQTFACAPDERDVFGKTDPD